MENPAWWPSAAMIRAAKIMAFSDWLRITRRGSAIISDCSTAMADPARLRWFGDFAVWREARESRT